MIVAPPAVRRLCHDLTRGVLPAGIPSRHHLRRPSDECNQPGAFDSTTQSQRNILSPRQTAHGSAMIARHPMQAAFRSKPGGVHRPRGAVVVPARRLILRSGDGAFKHGRERVDERLGRHRLCQSILALVRSDCFDVTALPACEPT